MLYPVELVVRKNIKITDQVDEEPRWGPHHNLIVKGVKKQPLKGLGCGVEQANKPKSEMRRSEDQCSIQLS
jgi:hypothetical protein